LKWQSLDSPRKSRSALTLEKWLCCHFAFDLARRSFRNGNEIVGINAGVAESYFFIGPASYGQKSSLSPDTLLLYLGDVAIMAIFDATKPANTRFRVNILYSFGD